MALNAKLQGQLMIYHSRYVTMAAGAPVQTIQEGDAVGLVVAFLFSPMALSRPTSPRVLRVPRSRLLQQQQ